MKLSLLHRLGISTVPPLAAWLIRLWFATCRIHEHNVGYKNQAVATGKPVIAVFWHYSLVFLIYHMRRYSASALISSSKDGDYIARLAEQLNFSTVRGSRNRHGLRALKGLLKRIEEGQHLAIVADGSQGPPLQVQGGPLLLAAKSGSLILPIVWSASRYYTFRSWDKLAVPKLFSRIDVYFGEPLSVTGDLDADGLDGYRQRLEQAMIGLYRLAWADYGKEGH